MINGYEDVFGINNGKKIYNMIEQASLYHNKPSNGPESNQTSTGRDACSLYYAFVEQTVKSKIYKDTNKLFSAAKKFCDDIRKYQADRRTELEDRAKIQELEQELSKVIKKADLIRSKKEMSRTDRTNLATLLNRQEDIETELESLNSNYKRTNRSASEIKNQFKDLVTENKEADKNNLEEDIDESLTALSDDSDKIKQALIDSTLKPGQEKEEERVASCADAMQDLSELEVINLKRKKEVVDEIVAFYQENGFEAELPETIQQKIDTIGSLDNLTDLVTDASFELYSDKKFSKFVQETLGALQDVKFGKEGVVSEQEIFNIGKKCGIPNRGSKEPTTLQGSQVGYVMSNASKLTYQMSAYQEKAKETENKEKQQEEKETKDSIIVNEFGEISRGSVGEQIQAKYPTFTPPESTEQTEDQETTAHPTVEKIDLNELKMVQQEALPEIYGSEQKILIEKMAKGKVGLEKDTKGLE